MNQMFNNRHAHESIEMVEDVGRRVLGVRSRRETAGLPGTPSVENRSLFFPENRRGERNKTKVSRIPSRRITPPRGNTEGQRLTMAPCPTRGSCPLRLSA